MTQSFKALQVTEDINGEFSHKIVEKELKDLPEGDLLVHVKYSSINYKDALSASGNKGVTRSYPHTPGIDAAGIVIDSSSSLFNKGDQVIVTGYDLGMNTWGGFSQYIRVPSQWVIKLPNNLSLKESMIYGTAGFTAALSVHKLLGAGIKPEDGGILVTGATGGVGSLALSILSKLNYKVSALSGKNDKKELLMSLGAFEVMDRKELETESTRPLLKSRWAGVIDNVGGPILSSAIKSTHYNGVVTSCGNIASAELKTSIYPFILRAVSLVGIDSVNCDRTTRMEIWDLLANEWKIDFKASQYKEIPLSQVSATLDAILENSNSGRNIINLDM